MEDELAAKSTLVAKHDRYFAYYTLDWLSPNELLTVVGTDLPDVVSCEAFALDVSTGASRPLDALNVLLTPLTTSVRRLSQIKKPHFRLSPDKQWLLAYNFYAGHRSSEGPTMDAPERLYATALSLDGQQQIAWNKQKEYTSAYWMANSRGWIEALSEGIKTRLACYTLDAPEVSFAMTMRQSDTQDVMQINWQSVLGVTSDACLLLFDGVRSIYEAMLTNEAAVLRQHRITTFPSRRTIERMILSLDGHHIAWLLDYWEEERESERVLREEGMLISLLEFPTSREIWVSNAQGADMRRVAQSYSAFWPNGQVFWCPDNERLAFVYNNALYALRVV